MLRLGPKINSHIIVSALAVLLALRPAAPAPVNAAAPPILLECQWESRSRVVILGDGSGEVLRLGQPAYAFQLTTGERQRLEDLVRRSRFFTNPPRLGPNGVHDVPIELIIRLDGAEKSLKAYVWYELRPVELFARKLLYQAESIDELKAKRLPARDVLQPQALRRPYEEFLDRCEDPREAETVFYRLWDLALPTAWKLRVCRTLALSTRERRLKLLEALAVRTFGLPQGHRERAILQVLAHRLRVDFPAPPGATDPEAGTYAILCWVIERAEARGEQLRLLAP